MKFRLIQTALVCTLACVSLPCSAAVLTFDSVGPTGNGIQSGTITVGSFDFTSPSFHIVDDPASAGAIDFGSEYLAVVAPGLDSPVTITAAGGGAFSLDSLEAARLFLTPGGIGGFPNADTVTVQGDVMGGGTISQSLTLPLEGSIESFSLSGFDDVTSVTLSGSFSGSDASFGVDDLAISLAPEPSYVWEIFSLSAGALIVAKLCRHLVR